MADWRTAADVPPEKPYAGPTPEQTASWNNLPQVSPEQAAQAAQELSAPRTPVRGVEDGINRGQVARDAYNNAGGGEEGKAAAAAGAKKFDASAPYGEQTASQISGEPAVTDADLHGVPSAGAGGNQPPAEPPAPPATEALPVNPNPDPMQREAANRAAAQMGLPPTYPEPAAPATPEPEPSGRPPVTTESPAELARDQELRDLSQKNLGIGSNETSPPSGREFVAGDNGELQPANKIDAMAQKLLGGLGSDETTPPGGPPKPPGGKGAKPEPTPWDEPKLRSGSILENLNTLTRAPIAFKVLLHDTMLKQGAASTILSPKGTLEAELAGFKSFGGEKGLATVTKEIGEMPWMKPENNPLEFSPNRLRQSQVGINVPAEAREGELQLLGSKSAGGNTVSRAIESVPFVQAGERMYTGKQNMLRAYQSNVMLQQLHDNGLAEAVKNPAVGPAGRTVEAISQSGETPMKPVFNSPAEKDWYQKQIIQGTGRYTSWMTPKDDGIAYQRGIAQYKAMQDVMNHRTQYGSWKQGNWPLFSTRAVSGRVQMLTDPLFQPGSPFAVSARQEAIKGVLSQAAFSGAQLGVAASLGARINTGSGSFGYHLPTATWKGDDGSSHSFNPWSGIGNIANPVVQTVQYWGQGDKQLHAWTQALTNDLSPTYSLGKEVALGTNWQNKTFSGTEKPAGSNPVQWAGTAAHNLGALAQSKDTYVQMLAPIWLESAINLIKHDPVWQTVLETAPALEASGVSVTPKTETKPLPPLPSSTSGSTTKPLPPLLPAGTSSNSTAPTQQSRPLPPLPPAQPQQQQSRPLPPLPTAAPSFRPSTTRTRVPIYGAP